jgi:hypothetical protein
MYTTKKSILSGMERMERNLTPYNSTYPKVAVQWLNQALCFYESFCLVDSEVLRKRHLRVAAKRYSHFRRHPTTNKPNDKNNYFDKNKRQ